MSTRDRLALPQSAQPQVSDDNAAAPDPRMRAAMQRRAQQRREPQPLDPEVRGEMESKIGEGFGDVRVHADSEQAGSAHAVAQGSDVHFAKDKYQPGSQEGKWLLAHELSHVVQQRKGATASQAFAPEAPRGQLEREADRAASTVMRGGRAEIGLGARPGMEQRAEAHQAEAGPHQAAEGPGTEVESSTEHPDELQNQSYAHGGFMGAAGEMLKDPLWCNILQALMPDVFAEVKDQTKAAKAMGKMENNPVMAAYGASKNLEHEGQDKGEAKPDEQHQTVPIEWDVWLDKEHPEDITKVKIAHGAQMATLLGQIPGIRSLVPHAAPSVKEGMPAMGGDANWVETFGKAISMFRAGGKLPEGAADKPPGEEQELLKKLGDVGDSEKMIATAKEFLSKTNGGGVVLDIKSTYSSPGDVAKFVAGLEQQGIDVRIVGSFRKEQLGDLNKGEGGDQREGSTRPVTFVHSIDGLEGKVKGGELQPGDHVMFNAADLLKQDPSGKDKWQENPDSLNRIAHLSEEKGLKIGLYLQETAAGPNAVKMVTRICNEHPELFCDGFAHGNVSGSTEGETEGSGMGAQNIPAAGEKIKNKLS